MGDQTRRLTRAVTAGNIAASMKTTSAPKKRIVPIDRKLLDAAGDAGSAGAEPGQFRQVDEDEQHHHHRVESALDEYDGKRRAEGNPFLQPDHVWRE